VLPVVQRILAMSSGESCQFRVLEGLGLEFMTVDALGSAMVLTLVCEDGSVVLEDSGSLAELTPQGLRTSPYAWL
jgi:hypothetical protein